MWLTILAQTGLDVPANDVPLVDSPAYAPSIWHYVSWVTTGWRGVIYVAFLLWMVIYCVKNDPERSSWLWIMLLFQPLGAVIYFFARFLPSTDIGELQFLKRWKKGKDLERLRVAARQIGNPYQHVLLGDAARELGRNTEALRAYQAALVKEPENLAALWGAANLEFQNGDAASARSKLEAVLDRDPAYKFGDVSLLYGKCLDALNEPAAAKAHMEQHLRRWRHPEGLYLLANLCVADKEPDQARAHLQELINDINASPRAIARKHLFWKSRAKRLLKRT